MLIAVCICIALLICLGLVKTEIIRVIMHTSHHISGGQNLGIWFYALFFLPGTILHELSHFLMAQLLRVRTGEVNILPHKEANYVKLGYVTVERSDVFRSFFIGSAPFFVGLGSLTALAWWQFERVSFLPLTPMHIWPIVLQFGHQPLMWVTLYGIIVLSHAMFLSEADRKEIYLVPIVLAILGGLAVLFRNTMHIPAGVLATMLHLTTILNIALAIAIVFNGVLLVIFGIGKKIVETVV